MDSWLVHLFLNQPLHVQVLAIDNAWCFWARHLTLTLPLATQLQYIDLAKPKSGAPGLGYSMPD